MNRLTKNILKWLAVIIVAIEMKYAGNCEYKDVVIGSMSYDLYQKVLYDLGGTATDQEICAKYIADKQAYDALGI